MNNHRRHHFLIISLPAQGHINPTLQLAKNLSRSGAARVTFATTVCGLRKLQAADHLPSLNRLYYASFSDGYDDDSVSRSGRPGYLDELKLVGSQSLTNLILKLSADGPSVTFLVYTILLPWAADVARQMHLPSAFLAIQSATSFSIYHRFFNTNDGIHTCNKDIDPLTSLELPGLPLLTCHDIPSFLLPNKPFHSAMVPTLQQHIQTLEQDPNPCVLANTFDALEHSSIKYIVPNVKFISIGPLLPSSFSDGKDQSDNSFGCDLFKSSSDIKYLHWLDSKQDRSVIYVSFGSLVVLQKRQKEELLEGLVESGRPFLWVLRDYGNDQEEAEGFKGKMENGLIVPWCSQVEVLCHPAIGCFVTHCGWNSMLESIVAGVGMVCCPHFSDQPTNAKMVEDVWGNGVRAISDDEGVVEKEEMKRCLDVVMGGGERGEEIRKNAVKWRGLAIEAVKEGGSSSRNLKEFLDTTE